MSKRNDISTPEGYFEDLRMRLSEIPAQPARVSTVRRLAPYVAVAASFLLIVMVGNFILGRTAAPTAEDDTWTYVSYLAYYAIPQRYTTIVSPSGAFSSITRITRPSFRITARSQIC